MYLNERFDEVLFRVNTEFAFYDQSACDDLTRLTRLLNC